MSQHVKPAAEDRILFKTLRLLLFTIVLGYLVQLAPAQGPAQAGPFLLNKFAKAIGKEAYSITSKGGGYTRGDPMLFSSAAMVEGGWRMIDPMLKAWSTRPPKEPLPNYALGSSGPEAADMLLTKRGHRWHSLEVK